MRDDPSLKTHRRNERELRVCGLKSGWGASYDRSNRIHSQQWNTNNVKGVAGVVGPLVHRAVRNDKTRLCQLS